MSNWQAWEPWQMWLNWAAWVFASGFLGFIFGRAWGFSVAAQALSQYAEEMRERQKHYAERWLI